MNKHKTFNKVSSLKYTIVFIISLVMLQSAKATVVSYTKSANGVVFKLDKGLMDIKVCKADIIEVKYTILNAFPDKNSLVVIDPWKQKSPFTVSDKKGQIIITTSKLIISINKTTNAISYANKKGEVITAEGTENKSMNT